MSWMPSRGQVFLVLLPAGSAILLGYLGLELSGAISGLSLKECFAGQQPLPPLQPLHPPLDLSVIGGWRSFVLISCVLGFVGGNAWGQFRTAVQEYGPTGEAEHATSEANRTSGEDARSKSPSLLVQVVLTGFFLFAAVALAYETFALAGAHGNPDLWPITSYIRCANDIATWPTLAGAVLASILVGHWLAYQPMRPAS